VKPKAKLISFFRDIDARRKPSAVAQTPHESTPSPANVAPVAPPAPKADTPAPVVVDDIAYLNIGDGDEGVYDGVYKMAVRLRQRGILLTIANDGRLVVTGVGAARLTAQDWQELRVRQRTIRALLPFMLTADEVKESAEKMRVIGQAWLAEHQTGKGN
jgi:hypothetical protein